MRTRNQTKLAKVVWSDERKACIKQAWDEGKSYGMIMRQENASKAHAVQVTRSMIASQVRRLGLKRDVECVKPKMRLPARPFGRALSFKLKKIKQAKEARPEEEESKFVPPKPDPKNLVPLLQMLTKLDEKGCRYPYGDDAPYLFCGLRQEEGSSYCQVHDKMCRNRVPARRDIRPEYKPPAYTRGGFYS